MPNIVRFYEKPKQNPAKSAEAGRPIFDGVEMVEVIVAGDKHFRPHFPAHEVTVTYDSVTQTEDRRTWAERYPDEYRAFKQQGFSAPSGTPIEAWPILTRMQIAELKALDIFTVEQIADMNDRNRHVLGPNARPLIVQAQTFIAQASDASVPQKLAAENEALKAEIERLKAEQQDEEDEGEFAGMTVPEIKDWIEERTGERPKGNPSKATLIRQAKAVEAA